MLLEDMYAVTYGGGGRSEGQLTDTTGADVGNAAAFLASDRARGDGTRRRLGLRHGRGLASVLTPMCGRPEITNRMRGAR